MIRLPKWVLNNRYPSVYDSESKTAIEQTARVYGAMQDLIDEYNKFTDTVNKGIEEFEKNLTDSNSVFKTKVCDIMENYIKCMDEKYRQMANQIEVEFKAQNDKIDSEFASQNTKIEEAVAYMKDNLVETTQEVINQAIVDGKFNVGLSYDETTETLSVITTGGV